MSSLPGKTPNYNKRDNKGRFAKSDTGSKSVQNTSAVNDDQAVNQSFPPTAYSSQTPPETPTGSFNKENQPNFEEVYLEDAERTKELKEQLAELEKEAEVKEIKGEIELPEIVKKQGVEVTGEETPLPAEPPVTLPLDDKKIYTIVKSFKKLHQNVKDSVIWLAWWCYRQLQLVHIKLKEVHGKIVRQSE